MNTVTITHLAPFDFPIPAGNGLEFPSVCHNGESFVFRAVHFDDLPKFLNTKTGLVRSLALVLACNIQDLPKHGKVKLTFGYLMVSPDGEANLGDWDWSEWVPYCPACPSS